MTEKITRKGPGLSTAQKIGDLARSALYANQPDNWNLGPNPGDDFGYDFDVTVFDPESEGAQCAFKIQLKGTTQKESRISEGKALSYPFDHATLNLWHRSGFAVLVVIVDLIDTLDQKTATVHYHFANDDLEDILPALPPDQKTVRLHIPTNQIVHKELDILPIVLPYLDEIADARRISHERRRAGGTTAVDHLSVDISNISANAPSEHIVVGNELEDFINASPKNIELTAALTALRGGDYELVFELSPYPSEEACKTEPRDSAIALYLRSLAFDAIGDAENATASLNLAYSLLPDCDDIVGNSAQKQLEKIEFGHKGQKARVELLESLDSHHGLSVTSVKSKILALNGKFDQAREILKSFSPEKIVTTEIVVSIVEKAWDRALTEVTTARKLSSLRPKQRLWLDVLEARARFEIALQSVPRPEGEFIVPSSGLPRIDYDELRSAYEVSRRAMMAAQRLNWPVDVAYILDVFPISAMLLGYIADALPLMIELGLARAAVVTIRESVSKMAVQFDQPEIALQLRERAGTSPSFEHEESVVAVAALKAGKITTALEIVTDEFLAHSSSKDVYLSSLLMLGMAASSTLRLDLLEKIRTRLGQGEMARHFLEILDSAVRIEQSPLKRHEGIQKLYKYWSEHNHPAVVGYHLLTNLNTRNEDEATIFIEIAECLEEENSLGNEQLADYGQALLTVGRVSEAITKLQFASNRFQHDPKIQSLLGISLERDGQSSEAFKLFERLLNEGKASETARRYFVEIAIRMGFFEQAEQQVRAAYASASRHDQKLRLLNTLYQLLIAEGKRPEEAEEVAWEYGKQANQSDEREEGIFLQEYLFATVREDLAVKKERIDEFRQRLDAYSERFPNSKFLWRAEIPKNGPPGTMLKALQEAVGLTDQDVEESKAIEKKMDRGALMIPFSWRPRRFLRNVPDIFMLWEIRKGAPPERAALHFMNNVTDYDRQVPKNIGDFEVVLSLTSLLMLDELDILDLVLNTFPRLIVARATLLTLQEARNVFTSGWGHEKATRIISQLQKAFSKISHPQSGLVEDRPGIPGWHHEEKRAMEQPGRVYFSDDIVETYLVCNADEKEAPKRSISTIDFLTWADQSLGIISPLQVADAIGHMIRLRVTAINVEQRYFIAAIPDALNRAGNQAQAEEALRGAKTFQSIVDGIWNHFKSFAELRTHFAANMCYLLNDSRACDEVLISLWLRWLGTVRFQTKPNNTPIQKMLSAFLHILDNLRPEKETVGKHWRIFWTTLHRGFAHKLNKSEDRVAIEEVGKILGTQRAIKENEKLAMDRFEKAMIGLEPGTEREKWFSEIYVESMAQQEITNQASK